MDVREMEFEVRDEVSLLSAALAIWLVVEQAAVTCYKTLTLAFLCPYWGIEYSRVAFTSGSHDVFSSPRP